MITNYFEASYTLRRLRAPKACTHIDSFAVSLHRAGYARWTIRGYLRAAAHFGRWADGAGLPVAGLDERALVRFRTRHLPTCRCIKRNRGKFADVAAGAALFLAHLRDVGVVPPAPPRPGEPVPPLLAAFGAWMRTHRGVTASTISLYARALRDVLPALGDEPGARSPAAWRALALAHAKRRGRGARHTLVCAMRALARFLVATGQCPVGLDRVIPAVAQWRLASLPRYLDGASVERVIAAAGRGGAPSQRLRDHAVVLLLARLGLRAGDVASLRFDDIDWDDGSLLVRGKGRRESRLPLPADVGEALAAYIERGRPEHAGSHIFLRIRAPHRPFSSYAAVSSIVQSALRRAGVESPQKGAHVLRHSAATAMLRAGVSLETVGAVLRHRSMQTTLQYAKIDLPSLSSVVQPWPAVPSC
ncbi:MAG: tyrosine-type recombinase/integrase [Gemmatimonadaceae bacterium]|jgi:site-specific recombinase XerD|nr:tyrosine-type recombinase/integrase [Gemmatimonadaceae bacterium]